MQRDIADWGRPTRTFVGRSMLLMASLLSVVPLQSHSIRVAVNLGSGADIGHCSRTRGPAGVSVECSSSEDTSVASGHQLHVYSAGRRLGTVESHMGDGTVTSWRVVSRGDSEYVEMVVGW